MSPETVTFSGPTKSKHGKNTLLHHHGLPSLPMNSPNPTLLLPLLTVLSAGLAGSLQGQTIEEGLDHPAHVTAFSTEASLIDGNVPQPSGVWTFDTSQSQVGGDSVISTLPNRATSRLETTVSGPATVSFRWKSSGPSSGASADILYFGVDGQGTLASLFGDTDWTQRSFEVDCGDRLVAWEFQRYSSSPAGNRSAWLDDLAVTPIPNQPPLQDALENLLYEVYSTDWLPAPVTGALNSNAAKSGPVGIGVPSTMMFEVEGPATVKFDWGITTGENDFAELELQVNGSTYGSIDGTRVLEPVELEVGPGTHCFKFVFLRSGGGGEGEPAPSEAYVDHLVINTFGPSPTLADAIDHDGLAYSNAWTRQTIVTHDGVDAAQVTSPTEGAYRRIYVDLPDEAGLLTFWTKTETEEDLAFLYMLLDGATVQILSGDSGWVKTEVNLEAGTDRELQGIFFRRTGSSLTGNRAFLDRVTFEPGADNYQPDLSIGPKGKKPLKGENKTNASGAGQISTILAKTRRPVGQYRLQIHNGSSSDKDRVNLQGRWSQRQFGVLFVVTVNGKRLNYTSALKTGDFKTLELDSGESETHEIWVIRGQEARARSHTVKVTGHSETSPTKIDTVKTRLLVK